MAIEQSPGECRFHNELGKALNASGDLPGAQHSYQAALAIDSNFADSYFNLGNLHRARADWQNARLNYEKAIAASPLDADTHNNLAVTLLDLALHSEALHALRRALELNPAYAEAHFNMGNVLAQMGDHKAAILCYDKAIGYRPHYGKSYQNRGAAKESIGDLDAAIADYEEALRLVPGDSGVASNLESARALRGDPDSVPRLIELAEQHPTSASAHWNLSMALLLHGDYARGWKEYEWRWRWDKFTSVRRNFVQPQWTGEDLAGKSIFLYAEQGLGDTLQFLRYLPLVEQRNGRLLVEVQPSVHPLAARYFDNTLFVQTGTALADFDVPCALMSLPSIFGTTMDSIPPPINYGAGLPPAQGRAGGGRILRVGLAWAGSPGNIRDHSRSFHLQELLPLLAVKGVCFLSLQHGPAAEQIAALDLTANKLQDLCSSARDLADTAAAISSLDLVITVDSVIAHLAGSMGKPVWVLLSHLPDWRWGLKAESTPWYPTARLFRQASFAARPDLIRLVEEALSQHVGMI